jgi:uroporphyrin-III C-methyltransferase/precorrin-2 dehydrogenase/sirohydrochlorin ferrochelatase
MTAAGAGGPARPTGPSARPEPDDRTGPEAGRVPDRRTQPDYPLTLRIAERRAVVVGGGPVAERRVRGLLDAGAHVILISPDVTTELGALARADRLTWVARTYRAGDLADAWLVHTATGSRAVDDQVAADADETRTWCVRTGDPAASAAWVPAVTRAGDVLVAVSAGGDPRRATRLRDGIATSLRTGRLPVRRRRSGTGSVALVGGGPGDLGLLTLRGRTLLGEADVVVVDRLAPRAVLAELDPDVLVIDVGKTPGHHTVPQDRINLLLVEHARAGRRVVRLKGGDPYVFGRGSEEATVLRDAGIPVEVVAGVTSAVSVPAAAGIPVTHRGLSRGFSVITGHEDLHALPPTEQHTIVLLMGVGHLGETCRALMADGRAPHTPVAVVEDGYGPGQRVTTGTLASIATRAAEVGVRSPAVTVIGDVVRLAPAWAQQNPPSPAPDPGPGAPGLQPTPERNPT